MRVSESGAPTKDVSTHMRIGVAGLRLAVTNDGAPSTALLSQLANKALSHGLGILTLG